MQSALEPRRPVRRHGVGEFTMSELEALRAEVERLTKENAHLQSYVNGGYGFWLSWGDYEESISLTLAARAFGEENKTLRARVQELEGLLQRVLSHGLDEGDGLSKKERRAGELAEAISAALESGTGPEESEYHWCGCTTDGASKCPVHAATTP